MCGIWGKISDSNSGQRIAAEEIVPAVRKLAHRGPDGYSWYHNPNAALLHTRLSIIDLATGRQPLESFDGRYLGVINGELYDYAEHRARLVSKGVTFKTQSDSEVLLNLFALEGHAGVAQLSGEFAFIFYDLKKHVFHFGRDIHGVKPLFMLQNGKTLTLASEAKALQDTTPEIDPTYLNQYICRILVPPRTAIKNVFHVWPGKLHTFDPKKGVIESVTAQALPRGNPLPLSRQEHVERVHKELSDAVKRRMVADVEVGCYLSGGVDSALVAALMVKNGGKPKAFTVGFSDADLDETEKAASIAQHLGISHETVRLGPGNFMESLERSIVAFENPIANTHGAAKNILSSLASSRVKVVLSGEGADEWFGGYPYLRIQKLLQFAQKHPALAFTTERAMELFYERENGVARGHLDGASREFEGLAREYFGGHSPAVLNRIPRARVRKHILGGDQDALIREAFASLSASYLNDLGDGVTAFPKSTSAESLNAWTSLRTDLLHYILGNLGDRQEMSHSLEGRTPFLDIRVAKVASELPANIMLHGLHEKSVLKEIAAQYLPKIHASQRKHPFFGPMRYLLMRKNREQLDASILAAKGATPWLPWKHIEHLVFRPKMMLADTLARDLSISLRLIFYSVGVLVEKLNQPQLLAPIGYALPENFGDILPNRFFPGIKEAPAPSLSLV